MKQINRKRLKKQSFFGGIIVLMMAHFFIKILGLIYKVYLTNREGFGDKGNAICGSSFQIYALLLTVSSIGVPNAVSKLVSEKVAIGDFKGAHKTFKIAFFTFSIIGFACSLVLYLGANIIANKWLQIPEAELTLVALSPSIFFVTLINVIRGYFNGRENLKVTANSQTIEQIAKMLFTVIIVEILAITSGVNTTIMAAGANLATTLATAIGFIYLYLYYKSTRKEIAAEIKQSINNKQTRIRKTIKQIVYVAFPMTLTAFLGSMNKSIDSFTVVRGLKSFLTYSEAKIQYGVLTGKIDILIMLPMSFNIALITTLIPNIASLRALGDIEKIKDRISESLLMTIIIGLPCMIGLILFAGPILQLLFPNQSSGEFVLQISAFSIIFIILEQTISGILQGLGKTFLPAIAIALGVIIKLVLNIILIPINPTLFILGGINGAAFSTVICHFIVFLIEYFILKKSLKSGLQIQKLIIRPLIATLIMGLICINLYNLLIINLSNKISIIITLVISALIYFFMILCMRVVNIKKIINLSQKNGM